jgi:DNA replication and repair protein RecF
MNVLTGRNGVGKTTILEAVHTLSMTRSYRTARLMDLVQNGQPAGKMVLETADQQLSLTMAPRKNDFAINQDKVAKQSDFVGQYHVITLAPEHDQLIQGSKTVRQQWMDHVATLVHPPYLQWRKDLHKVTAQKKALLNQELPKAVYLDRAEPWTEQQQLLSAQIRQVRQPMIQAMAPMLAHHYQSIAQTSQRIDITYQIARDADQWTDTLKDREYYAKRVLLGAQRDDFALALEGQGAKKDASQGEKASILLALKLSELDYTMTETKKKPVFLLDDIGMTLDQHRRAQLFDKINAHQYQTLLTTCDPNITNALEKIGATVFGPTTVSGKIIWEPISQNSIN